MRVKEKVQLSDLIEVVQKKILFSQCHPQDIKANIRDLNNLSKVSESEFFTLATELRKKAVEREKALRESESQAFELRNLFANQPGANWQLAYNILAMSSPPLLKQQKPKLLKELKLSFLESFSVTTQDWNLYLRAQLNALAIKIPETDAEVILGLSQKENSKILEWTIFGAKIGGVFNSRLWQFSKGVLEYNKQFKQDWKRYVISDIRNILEHLEGLVLFLQLVKSFPLESSVKLGYGQQKVDCSWQEKGISINAVWFFDLQKDKKFTHFKLIINETIVLNLQLSKKKIIGQLSLVLNEKKLNFRFKDEMNFISEDLINIPKKIFELQKSISNLYNKYPQIADKPHSLFIHLMNRLWFQNQQIANQCAGALKEGVWMHVPIENGFLFHIQADGLLQNDTCIQRFIVDLLQKQISIDDICRHLRLFSKVRADNEAFQYKFYDIKYGKSNEDDNRYVIYEFRSNKFHSNQKHPRMFKNQDLFVHPDNTSFDNIVLNVKVSFDFTAVHFTSWKYHEGPRTESDKGNYLKSSWTDYKNQLMPGEKISWQNLADAIGYFCRCYLVERVRYRVFSEEDRRVNAMDFI